MVRLNFINNIMHDSSIQGNNNEQTISQYDSECSSLLWNLCFWLKATSFAMNKFKYTETHKIKSVDTMANHVCLWSAITKNKSCPMAGCYFIHCKNGVHWGALACGDILTTVGSWGNVYMLHPLLYHRCWLLGIAHYYCILCQVHNFMQALRFTTPY